MKILNHLVGIASRFIEVNRLKSLLWRTGASVVAVILGALANDMSWLRADVFVTLIIGNILGELTKAINNYLSENTPA